MESNANPFVLRVSSRVPCLVFVCMSRHERSYTMTVFVVAGAAYCGVVDMTRPPFIYPQYGGSVLYL